MFLNFQNFTSQVLKKPKNLTSVSYKTVSYKTILRVCSSYSFHQPFFTKGDFEKIEISSTFFFYY